MIVLANFFVKKNIYIGWETFRDSVKFTWDSTFVDALGPMDAIKIKPKSNTGLRFHLGKKNLVLFRMSIQNAVCRVGRFTFLRYVDHFIQILELKIKSNVL